jgi:hypothetical protein
MSAGSKTQTHENYNVTSSPASVIKTILVLIKAEEMCLDISLKFTNTYVQFYRTCDFLFSTR